MNLIAGFDEYLEGIREAALTPGLFRELYESHRDASDQSVKSYLIVKKGFSELGAREATRAFRDTTEVARLGEVEYKPLSRTSDEIEETADATERSNAPLRPSAFTAPALSNPSAPRLDEKPAMAFRWLIGTGVVAEVKLIGAKVKPSHLDLLAKQLELTKLALQMDVEEEESTVD